MAFVKEVNGMYGNLQKPYEVYVKKEELIKVLKQQGIFISNMPSKEDSFCLTFIHSNTEQYDY
jgi:hypothetical protein